MASTKIFFDNHLDDPVYVFLVVNDGTLQMHFFDQPQRGATTLPAGKRVSFDVTPAIQSCIRNGSLSFELIGHNDHAHPMTIIPGASRLPEGPVFAITSMAK